MGIILSQTKPGTFSEETTTNSRYDDFFVASRGKSRCKRCHGRGKLNYDNPTTRVKWTEMCDCVTKDS